VARFDKISKTRYLIGSLLFAGSFILPILVFFILPVNLAMLASVLTFFGLQISAIFSVLGFSPEPDVSIDRTFR
jgi:hypothetical protein